MPRGPAEWQQVPGRDRHLLSARVVRNDVLCVLERQDEQHALPFALEGTQQGRDLRKLEPAGVEVLLGVTDVWPVHHVVKRWLLLEPLGEAAEPAGALLAHPLRRPRQQHALHVGALLLAQPQHFELCSAARADARGIQ
eukprot:scaffold31815_cov118-Isochrysis_galbana.AAC.23